MPHSSTPPETFAPPCVGFDSITHPAKPISSQLRLRFSDLQFRIDPPEQQRERVQQATSLPRTSLIQALRYYVSAPGPLFTWYPQISSRQQSQLWVSREVGSFIL